MQVRTRKKATPATTFGGNWVIPRESITAAGRGEPDLARTALSYRAMPAPHSERQALERERRELADQLASFQTELDATAPEHTARRERLQWQIRQVRKRMTEVDRRLAGSQSRRGGLWSTA